MSGYIPVKPPTKLSRKVAAAHADGLGMVGEANFEKVGLNLPIWGVSPILLIMVLGVVQLRSLVYCCLALRCFASTSSSRHCCEASELPLGTTTAWSTCRMARCEPCAGTSLTRCGFGRRGARTP